MRKLRTIIKPCNLRSTFFKTIQVLIMIFAFCIPTFADNVAIDKVRLIQTNDSTYVLEVDISQALLWTIKAPIFPDRFSVSELKYTQNGNWLLVQATAISKGEPLNVNDEILLPWARNGSDVTVQWLDGSIHQGLFLRDLAGINIPVRQLMDFEQSLGAVSWEHFENGIRHVPFLFLHILFVLLIFTVFPIKKAFWTLLALSFGQAIAMPLAELGVGGFPLIFTELLGASMIFILAVQAILRSSNRHIAGLFFLFGLLHALSYYEASSILNLTGQQRIVAMFMCNVGIDLGHFLIVGFLALIFSKVLKNEKVKKYTIYAAGSGAVTILLLLFNVHVKTGKTDIFHFQTNKNATQSSLPINETLNQGGQKPSGARQLTNPVMCYLSVEPNEVRQEILVNARSAVQFLGVNDEGMGGIPISSQQPLKNYSLDLFQQENKITIDGEIVKAVVARADFVTLSAAGVIVREAPEIESLDNGILGITLVYETEKLASEINIDWGIFTEKVPQIESTSVDPFGSSTQMLSQENNILYWKSRLEGYKVPAIEEIAVAKPLWPIPSVLIFVFVMLFGVFILRNNKIEVSSNLMLGIVALGFILYPFARFSLDLPGLSQIKPSEERTIAILDDLLTNVYRSFDMRNEEAIYDRLAISVDGEQLTQIYLENRKSMELENRGGARAKVDKVEIKQLNSIKRAGNNTFLVDAEWLVSGSVNHFGHTHYRRNYYHSSVKIAIVDDTWKIQNIELVEEKRLL